VCKVFPKQGLICSFSCSTNSALGAVKFHFNTLKRKEVTNSFNNAMQSVFTREDVKLSIKTTGCVILTLRSFSSLNRPSLPLYFKRGGPSISASAEDFLDDCNHKNRLVCYDKEQKLLSHTLQKMYRDQRKELVAKYRDLHTTFTLSVNDS